MSSIRSKKQLGKKNKKKKTEILINNLFLKKKTYEKKLYFENIFHFR